MLVSCKSVPTVSKADAMHSPPLVQRYWSLIQNDYDGFFNIILTVASVRAILIFLVTTSLKMYSSP